MDNKKEMDEFESEITKAGECITKALMDMKPKPPTTTATIMALVKIIAATCELQVEHGVPKDAVSGLLGHIISLMQATQEFIMSGEVKCDIEHDKNYN